MNSWWIEDSVALTSGGLLSYLHSCSWQEFGSLSELLLSPPDCSSGSPRFPLMQE